ncbi:hypothetical protein [Actinomadura sp. DC4]|uniref:hypothetical protein n=1 Tax=Actinomadura sp. DC4 TaxID=3055069 RepID=UPI0025AEEAC0|nr:hypothetical protein [Actinomadura sp. DC4]MDN3359693.1 hypothetical protein [Actinomadura sp. DC4]
MSVHEPAPGEENALAAPSASGGVLDAAPITVLREETQPREPAAPGNRRRRTGIAVVTATGVVALAAAPFAMVAPQAHLTSESASSPAKTHQKPAGGNTATDKKEVVIPAPGWRGQGSSQQPPTLPSQPASPVVPAPADSPDPWGSPSDPPKADPASGGEPDPARSPADTGSGSDSSPSATPEPKRNHVTAEAKPVRRARPAPQEEAKPATPNWQARSIQGTYVLQPGQNVHSNRMRLSLRTDGDLVLSDEHGKVVWSTGTHASGTHVVFQADGNLVLYSSTNATLWSTRTDGHDGAVLVLRANGDMAITQGGAVLWHTGTAK